MQTSFGTFVFVLVALLVCSCAAPRFGPEPDESNSDAIIYGAPGGHPNTVALSFSCGGWNSPCGPEGLDTGGGAFPDENNPSLVTAAHVAAGLHKRAVTHMVLQFINWQGVAQWAQMAKNEIAVDYHPSIPPAVVAAYKRGEEADIPDDAFDLAVMTVGKPPREMKRSTEVAAGAEDGGKTVAGLDTMTVSPALPITPTAQHGNSRNVLQIDSPMDEGQYVFGNQAPPTNGSFPGAATRRLSVWANSAVSLGIFDLKQSPREDACPTPEQRKRGELGEFITQLEPGDSGSPAYAKPVGASVVPMNLAGVVREIDCAPLAQLLLRGDTVLPRSLDDSSVRAIAMGSASAIERLTVARDTWLEKAIAYVRRENKLPVMRTQVVSRSLLTRVDGQSFYQSGASGRETVRSWVYRHIGRDPSSGRYVTRRCSIPRNRPTGCPTP
jgi:hypothetical protein